MYRNVHFTNVSSVYGGSRKWRRRWGVMHEHVHSRSQLSDTQVKLDLFSFHWATAGAKQRCCCHDNRLTRSIDLLGQSGANQRESKMLIVFQQKAKTCELTPPTSACTVPLPVRLTPPQKLLMILIRKQQVTMMPSNQPHWNQCDHNIWEKSKHVLNMETGNCTHAVTVVSHLQAWWYSKTTATFWSLFNHQSCSWSHQRPSQAQPWKHKETKEKCSFVWVSSQSAVLPLSGCGWRLPLGALSDPPLPFVHDLSCRGRGCSERCHSLRRHHHPRFQRKTRQTAAASHKHNNLKDSGEGYTPPQQVTQPSDVVFVSWQDRNVHFEDLLPRCSLSTVSLDHSTFFSVFLFLSLIVRLRPSCHRWRHRCETSHKPRCRARMTSWFLHQHALSMFYRYTMIA